LDRSKQADINKRNNCKFVREKKSMILKDTELNDSNKDSEDNERFNEKVAVLSKQKNPSH